MSPGCTALQGDEGNPSQYAANFFLSCLKSVLSVIGFRLVFSAESAVLTAC